MRRPASAVIVGHGLDAISTAVGIGLYGSSIEKNPLLREVANAIALHLIYAGSSLPAWTVAGVAIGVLKVIVAIVAAVGLVVSARFVDERSVAVYGYLLGAVGAAVALGNLAVMAA